MKRPKAIDYHESIDYFDALRAYADWAEARLSGDYHLSEAEQYALESGHDGSHAVELAGALRRAMNKIADLEAENKRLRAAGGGDEN